MTRAKISVKSVEVAANSSCNITVVSEMGPFIMSALEISDLETARSFVVNDILIGGNSQLYFPGAIHADFFSNVDLQRGVLFETLPRGLQIRLVVTNISNQPVVFKADLIGDVVRDNEARRDFSTNNRIFGGFGNTEIQPKVKGSLSMKSFIPCKLDGLVVPSFVLDDIEVISVRVVGEEVMDKKEFVDGMMLLKPSKMEISDWVCVDVVNNSDTQKVFCGSIVGSTAS